MTFEIQAAARRRTRRVITIVGVAVLAMLAVTVGVVLAFRNGDETTVPASSLPSSAPWSPLKSATSSASATAGAGGEFGAVTWTDVHGLALPVSTRHGPTDTGGGRAARFSHDRPGAVLAAVHISARATALGGPAVFRPTIRDQVVGADADELLANVDVDYGQRRSQVGVAAGESLPDSQAALAGYQVDSATESAVSVRVLMSSPGVSTGSTIYVVFQLEVRWARGDWRLVAPSGGLWANNTALVDSTSGYTPFPGR